MKSALRLRTAGGGPETSARGTQPIAGAAPRSPAWLMGVLFDGSFAVGAYFLSYWLRFPDTRLAPFLDAARSTLPLVVCSQLAVLALARAYNPGSGRARWFLAAVIGAVGGTMVGALLISLLKGFQGMSRMALVADTVMLGLAATAWRGIWDLTTQPGARGLGGAQDARLVDRSEELTTLSAVIASLYRYRELLKALVIKDLKLKYRGSVFGFLWSLLNPLLMIIVYTVAFTFILRIRGTGFVFYVMLGQLSWTFFANSAGMSTGAIVDNAGLLKSVFFPRAIMPIGTVLFNLAQYLLTAFVFLPVMLIWYRVPLSPEMLLYPVFLALQLIFTIGIGLMLATGTAFFRDVRHLLEVALAVLFWTTPIVYELRQVPDEMRLLTLLSPVSPFVVAYQKMFFYREWPDATIWVLAGTYAVGAFIVGAALHLGFEDRFTEQL